MDNTKIDKLKALLELSQNDTITPKEVEKFLVTILSVIKQSKDSFEKLSSENLKQIDLILTQIKKNYENSINTLDSKSNAVVEQIEAKLALVNDTLAKVKKIKAIPGKDGYTPKKGVDYFDGENGKPGDNGSPDTAEQIANKLETLKDDARLDASAIKNLPEFIDSRPNGGGWRNLFQLHDVDSSDNTTGYVLTRKADGTFNFQAGGGGSGDVVGPASATDNAIARFDTTTGKLIQNSVVTIDDTTGKIKINSTQTVYLPDQTSFTGSLVVGTGGNSISNIGGGTGIGNSFFGINTGNANTIGYNNSFFGYNTGNLNTSGFYNTFIGSEAGSSNITGGSLTFIGYKAGSLNTVSNNTFIGYQSGKVNTTGISNVFLGLSTGIVNDIGSKNTFLGYITGLNNSSGSKNTFIGYLAGRGITLGSGNTVIGHQDINTLGITTGSDNTIVGSQISGLSTTLSNNIILADGQGNIRAQWASTGALKLTPYGAGTFTGTATKNLAVDASGNVIEVTPTTGTVTSVGTAGLISGGAITGTGTITTSMATNKLVGRATAGTGIMEEITLGTGLSYTGTTLNVTVPSPSLTATYIGYGDGSNLLTGSSAFTYASGLIKNTATTEQLRLGYDASNYLSNTISSNGTTSYAITSSSGTPTFNFNKEMIVDLGTIPYVGQYAHHIKATDVLFGGTYEIITNFGYNYTTQYWTAQSRNPGIIEFDGGTQSFSFRSGNGGYTDIFGYNKLELRSLSGQPINIKNGSTTNIQVTGAGNIELQDSVKLLTYGSGTHSGTPAYTLQVDASGNVIEGSPSGGSGITRSVSSVAVNTTGGATAQVDYVYIVSGTTTLTLPTAVGNTNRYTVKRTDATLTTTIATTSAQTIDGGAGYTLTSQYESIDLISDGSNWLII